MASRATTVPSLFTLYGPYCSGSCGYCKGTNSGERNTWGMGTTFLTVSDYQYLIDRGWRRSGTYCYKPINESTCCPCYTICCDALHFQLSRSQKRILRDVRAFLDTGTKVGKTRQTSDISRSDSSSSRVATLLTRKPILITPDALGDRPSHLDPGCTGSDASDVQSNASKVDKLEGVSVIPSGDGTGSECVTNSTVSKVGSVKLKKARQKRWNLKKERMQKRAEKESRTFEELMKEYMERRTRRVARNQPKELEDLLPPNHRETDCKHYIEIRLVRSQPQSVEFKQTLQAEHILYQKYQQEVHGDHPNACSLEQFKRFLVKSPLVPDYKTRPTEAVGPEMGSYHQQYWLDGHTLIAVGVIDLLPHCLSSVYFIYDPDYAFLHLGVYSALQEIAFVRRLAKEYGPHSTQPDPQYAEFNCYYMGYFIRSCPKMAYKAQYRPSWLACPESYSWVPVAECLAQLDASADGKYARFSDPSVPDVNAIPSNLSDDEVEAYVLCHLSSRALGMRDTTVPLSLLKPMLPGHTMEMLHECVRLLGRRVLSGNIRFIF